MAWIKNHIKLSKTLYCSLQNVGLRAKHIINPKNEPKCFLFCTGLYTPGFEIDFSTEFVMGHSSGAHITTNYMKLGCHNIKGMILISPVDGVDPFGLIEDFCITPGEKLPFTTPTLIITAGRLLEGWRQPARFTNFLAEMRFCCFGSSTTFIVANVRKMPNRMG